MRAIELGLSGSADALVQHTKKVLSDAGAEDLRRTSRQTLARLVAGAVQPRFANGSAIAVPGAVIDGSPFLSVEPPTDVPVPQLPLDLSAQIDFVVMEHERVEVLAAAGLTPTRSLLFTGPPGVGKTLTARWIATRLGVPLLRADLATMMSSYLGQSAQNLRAALVQSRAVPSVLLLDEFDALAKRRDDPSDVGELKRVVNVLLLELDNWPPTSLLIGATNHPELLDRAIWRRFERTLTFPLPDDEMRKGILEGCLRGFPVAVDPHTIATCAAVTDGLSGSELAMAVRLAVRRSVLERPDDLERLLVEQCIEQLRQRAGTNPLLRRQYARACTDRLGLTQREIAMRLGVSHVAIHKLLVGRK